MVRRADKSARHLLFFPGVLVGLGGREQELQGCFPIGEILQPDDSRSHVSRGEGKGIANVGSQVSGRQGVSASMSKRCSAITKYRNGQSCGVRRLCLSTVDYVRYN
jgi:hypothetical protein